jgi:HPt (histidine-containing phosphotransfer) domain-containing protein
MCVRTLAREESPAKRRPHRLAVLLLDDRCMVPVFAPELPADALALESSVLDVSVMVAIRSLGGAGEPDVYEEVARLFLADVPLHLSALGVAIAANSVESVEQIAHRLRGGALEMGALRMAPLCAAIEHAARAGSLEHAAARAETLDREFAAARVALEQAITERTGRNRTPWCRTTLSPAGGPETGKF